MKIAQVFLPSENPLLKANEQMERVVLFLTEELARQGHEMVLLDAKKAEPLFQRGSNQGKIFSSAKQEWAEVLQKEPFDVVHFHTRSPSLVLPSLHTPQITTWYGERSEARLSSWEKNVGNLKAVSVSNAKRRLLPELDWVKTVYPGVPTDLFRPTFQSGSYLLFLDGFCAQKRADRAIEIALQSGLPLKIVGVLEKTDLPYFQNTLTPLLRNNSQIEWRRELSEKEKQTLLENALAVLSPTENPEPYNLALIEAMACGTPVIAFPTKCAEEIISQGENGYLASSVEEAVSALREFTPLLRRRTYGFFLNRFTVQTMAAEYADLYEMARNAHFLSTLVPSGPTRSRSAVPQCAGFRTAG